MHLNLELRHVPGSKNSKGAGVVDDFNVPEPFISNRSLRTVESGVETQDPLVVKLAEAGEADPDYVNLIKFISSDISNDSSYSDCKSILPFLSVTELEGGKLIVVKDSHEVLVPKAERKKLVDSLHFTHMSADSMLKMAKGSIVWPGLKNDLGIKYKHCEACLVNAKQKIDKPDQIPQDLTSLFPC